jgi:hypothetical protein
MLEAYFQTMSDVMTAESKLMAGLYRHPGKLGENREALLQRFLSSYLPERFGVGSGFALFGATVSTQQDVVVYDRINNPILFRDTVAPLFPPSALAAVVEVKSTLRKTMLTEAVEKACRLKRELRQSFAHHPAPPRSEALACLFAFATRGLSVAGVLAEMRRIEDKLGIGVRDRLDAVCVLGQGLVLGGSLFYSTTSGGEPLLAGSPPLPQERLAAEMENSLLVFYSRLLDYIVGRGDVRPQLMSLLPPDMPLGTIVAVG